MTRPPPDAIERIAHGELLNSVPLGCIDGRRSAPVVGSPGGSIGEVIVVATAIEAVSGELHAGERRALLELLMLSGAMVYHHTDVEHLEQLARGIDDECSPQGAAGVVDWIRQPPTDCRARLLELVVHPAHVGCGHLAGMLREPEKYGTQRGLVEEAIRTFYLLLWSGNPKLILEVLEGHHDEDSVVVVPSCGGPTIAASCAAIAPKAASSFVYHPDAARFVRESLVKLAHTALKRPDASLSDLMGVANQLATRQLQVTVHDLAGHLQQVHLEPCTGTAPVISAAA